MKHVALLTLAFIISSCGDGELEGLVESYYENGQLMSRTSYKNGYARLRPRTN